MATVQLQMPVKGNPKVTSPFGQRSGEFHKGVDWAEPVGTPVYAAAPGRVVQANYSTSAGNWVVIQHSWGTTKYMHNSRLAVKAGQSVKAGQLIAYSGNTGQSTGPHVHFQVEIPTGNAVNPLDYIGKGGTYTSGGKITLVPNETGMSKTTSAAFIGGLLGPLGSFLVEKGLSTDTAQGVSNAVAAYEWWQKNRTRVIQIVAGMIFVAAGLTMMVFDVDGGKILKTAIKVAKVVK